MSHLKHHHLINKASQFNHCGNTLDGSRYFYLISLFWYPCFSHVGSPHYFSRSKISQTWAQLLSSVFCLAHVFPDVWSPCNIIGEVQQRRLSCIFSCKIILSMFEASINYIWVNSLIFFIIFRIYLLACVIIHCTCLVSVECVRYCPLRKEDHARVITC